jgi:hypothetical protein
VVMQGRVVGQVMGCHSHCHKLVHLYMLMEVLSVLQGLTVHGSAVTVCHLLQLLLRM